MKRISTVALLAASCVLTLAISGTASATPVYPTPGSVNPVLYTFTATNTGTITAYFAGSTAAYDNQLTMLVNGVATGIQGLDNQTTAIGASLVMGNVNAGDTIVFKLITISPASGVGPWYSDRSMNSDGVNHVFSTAWAGDGTVPAGTYVSFEDLPNGGDLNYNDEDFVFTNTSTQTRVPEPSSLLLLGTGLGVLTLFRKRIGNIPFLAQTRLEGRNR